MEVWENIEGYKGIYEISNLGRVKSLPRLISNSRGSWISKERILKPRKDKFGYYFVALCKDGEREEMKVHRLVASAFIPNPSNLPQINHIDEDKVNNHINNLEWCTAKYNTNYGTRTERVTEKLINHEKKSKRVLQFDFKGVFIKEWLSIKECGRNGFSQSAVSSCCDNNKLNNKTYKGFIWKYRSEFENDFVIENSEIKRLINRNAKSILQYTSDGVLVREWAGAFECELNGFIGTKITACCRGKRQKHKGYIWKYAGVE